MLNEGRQPSVLVHEESYKKPTLISWAHRKRLTTIFELFRKYTTANQVSWADFGCSNGFIIEEIVRSTEFPFERICGYDHKEELLDLGRAKNIPRTTFQFIDMNQPATPDSTFDLVTCFETLEHVGDYRNAVHCLYAYLNAGGRLFIVVPNETALPGLVKFIGRMLARRRPYGEFFQNKSRLSYFKRLLLNQSIEGFREPGQPGYGPHLGFDYRSLRDFVRSDFIDEGKLEEIAQFYTFLHLNHVMILQKPKSS